MQGSLDAVTFFAGAIWNEYKIMETKIYLATEN